MKTFSWPVWFPYPGAWFGALILGLFNIIAGYSLKHWFETGIALAEAFQKPGPLFFCLFLGLTLPFAFLSYIHQKIWKPARPSGWPENLPSPISMWAGFYSFNVYSLSSLFTVALFISFCDFNQLANLSSPEEFQAELYSQIDPYIWIWFISAAYLYHIEAILRYQSQLLPKTEVSQPAASPKSKSSTKKSMRTGISKQSPKAPQHQTDDEIERMFEELQWQSKKQK